jgi:uncharacterized integral membrane protein
MARVAGALDLQTRLKVDRSTQTHVNAPDELNHYYKTAATVIKALITLTLLLVAIVALINRYAVPKDNPALDMAWRITVVIVGFGAVALRRTKFAAMRLQDIAALKGLSGLLETLQKTTVRVGLLGGAIAFTGVTVSIVTGYSSYALISGVIAFAVLLYSYPRKSAWQQVVQAIEKTGDADAPPAKGNTA